MPREKKAQIIDRLQEVFSKCSIGILTDYRGLSVPEITNLRRKLKDSGIEYKVVNVERLNGFPQGSTVGLEALVGAGVIKSSRARVKVLGQGELGHALTVEAHKFSASAREKIEAAGGSVVEIG